MSVNTYDVCIRGSGIVGRALALLLARHRLHVGLVESPAFPGQQADIRAYAINHKSQALLASLKCWPGPDKATPVREMRVWGDAQSQTVFSASQLQQEAVTWIADVPTLEHMLQQACQYQGGIEVITAEQAEADPAPLTVICEGKHSTTRAELGVEYDVTPYRQSAIATRATLDAPHRQIAWQWFAHTGNNSEILAFLPLGGPDGQEVGIVWSVDRGRVPELLALDDAAFATALDSAAHLQANEAPHVTAVQRRVAWPLQLGMAQRLVGSQLAADGKTRLSWALAGDAAHSVHPLAGQGLNLGLADVALLGEILGQRPLWRSTGDMHLLRQYERARKTASAPLIAGMDGIQRLFSHNAAGVRQLRNLGMALFDRSGPVKDWVARRAMD